MLKTGQYIGSLLKQDQPNLITFHLKEMPAVLQTFSCAVGVHFIANCVY